MDIRYFHDGTGRDTFVFGHEFGPCLIAHATTCHEALEEFDEHFGEPVDPKDPALLDYGDDHESGLESAIECGEARWSDSGPVWVSPYEWIREFPSLRAAVRFCDEWTTERRCHNRRGVEFVR